MHSRPTTAAAPPWGTWTVTFGLASMWLVYPLLIGPLTLLREFYSLALLCASVLWCLRQHDPEAEMLPVLAWSLLLAATANAGQGLVQAYQLWRHTGVSDVYGYLHQRNQLATLLLMGLAACGWIAARPSLQPRSAQRMRALTHLVAMLLGAAVSLSASRTGLLSLVLLWGASELLARKCSAEEPAAALRRVLRGAVCGYVVALAPTLLSAEHSVGILARQDAQEGVGVCTSRLSLWANVLELIRLKPWLGWGWGELDYAHFVTLFQGARFCALLANAHNLPLQLAVELGVPLALLVCSLALWYLWRGQPWREQHPDRLFAWGVLLVAGTHSLLEYPLWYGPFQASTVLCVWILVRTPQHTTPTAPAARTALPRALVKGLTLALGSALLAAALLAADYYRASQIYLLPAQRLGLYRDATAQKIQTSLFFQDVIDFAQLGLTEVTADNAQPMHALALKMLHFSPEAMVVQKLLTSARLLGLQDAHDFYLQRFAAAYPEAFVQWKASQPGD